MSWRNAVSLAPTHLGWLEAWELSPEPGQTKSGHCVPEPLAAVLKLSGAGQPQRCTVVFF